MLYTSILCCEVVVLMTFGASVHFYMQLLFTKMKRKWEKYWRQQFLPKLTNFFNKRDNFGWLYNANDTSKQPWIWQANNLEFDVMEIYKEVLFIGLSYKRINYIYQFLIKISRLYFEKSHLKVVLNMDV